jgi:hypothetical protein
VAVPGIITHQHYYLMQELQILSIEAIIISDLE